MEVSCNGVHIFAKARQEMLADRRNELLLPATPSGGEVSEASEESLEQSAFSILPKSFPAHGFFYY